MLFFLNSSRNKSLFLWSMTHEQPQSYFRNILINAFFKKSFVTIIARMWIKMFYKNRNPISITIVVLITATVPWQGKKIIKEFEWVYTQYGIFTRTLHRSHLNEGFTHPVQCFKIGKMFSAVLGYCVSLLEANHLHLLRR